MADENISPLDNHKSASPHALIKSVLLQREIRGFLIGGEKRLLFSEINEELCRLGVDREAIFEKLKYLQLQLTEASSDQRSVIAANLGLNDPAPLGEQYLIRQTDAERLCGAVVRSQRLASDADITINTFKVQHEIFGKSRGLFIPELYTHSSAECITCIQCRALLAPQDFVRHNHSPPKNQVRHWGLESTRWWRYVFVAKDQENREHFQGMLEELKQKYSSRQGEEVTTQSTTEPSSISSKLQSATTASIFSQLAALQEAATKSQPQSALTSAMESFMSFQQQRQRFYSSLRGYDAAAKTYGDTSTSFAEIMASAMAAAAAAVASSAPTASTNRTFDSAFVPPPNIKLQDVFKNTGSIGSILFQHRNDDDEESSAKRRRLDNDSNSPFSMASAENNNNTDAAIATAAAISSAVRLQSESASILAVPAQILLADSKPLVVPPESPEEPERLVVVTSDSSGEEEPVADDNTTILRSQLAEEIALLKKAFAKHLASQNSSVVSSGESPPPTLMESAEKEVEQSFDKGIIDEFMRLRAKHHMQTADRHRQLGANQPGASAAPKHMTVMGKYLGELQEAKNDLESRVRQLTAELRQSKEDYNSVSLRLMEKERESNEIRQYLAALLSGSSPSSSTSNFFTPATTSALSAALFGPASKTTIASVDPIASFQQQLIDQRRALLYMGLGSSPKLFGTHSQDEYSIAMAMASTSASNPENNSNSNGLVSPSS